MEQSSSWEADRASASQEILPILWDLQVHYRIQKRPPPVPFLNHMNPAHVAPSHILKTRKSDCSVQMDDLGTNFLTL
jgi:hypothetical protein